MDEHQDTAWRYLTPPHGRQVRRLIALLTLAAGVPRLPGVAEVLPFAPQRYLQPEVFGVWLTLTGVLLLATAYRLRLTVWGRLAALAAFVGWLTLAAATTSATSLLIDLAVAGSLLMEVGSLRDE